MAKSISKVNSYAPAWLCRPSPGANLFTSSSAKSPAQDSQTGTNKTPASGATRTIARRGNEVFAVVNNEIRWSDLSRLKDQWQQQVRQKKGSASKAKEDASGTGIPDNRVLTVPVYGVIEQILPSPNGAFLAIVTEHTVHISVLPDSSHLSSTDTTPIRLKTYQLGPTTHVIPESPVVSALWHPLGLHTNLGGCIVTVTADAAVRVWELDRNNHWSFDQPTLAVDLTKLINGTSSDQDFTPLGFGKSKGFSADAIDMEVASACFAGSGNDKEDAWAPMTLWVAMKTGDLYALCPLLPSKWQAPPTTIPSLTAAIVPKLEALEQDCDDKEELIASRQQYDWLQEIDGQEPLDPPDTAIVQGADVFTRPVNPSAIPRLQGPFCLESDDESDPGDVCDILVIPSRLNVEDLMMEEEEELAVQASEEDKLSLTVVCLTQSNGRVHICLELEGVEGQWLPHTSKNTFAGPSKPTDLTVVETLDTVKLKNADSIHWPTFTKDAHSRYSFFVTTATNVMFFSLSSWVQRLEPELQVEDQAGSDFRLEVLCSGDLAHRERILQVPDADVTAPEEHLAASIVFSDFNLGYMLLTTHPSNPFAAVMNTPEDSLASSVDFRYSQQKALPASLPAARPRVPYQVPAVFYAKSPLEDFVESHVPHRQRHTLKEQVRLSPATLDLITTAHRLVSAHTTPLERAASDLFRRCERLRDEMRDQLKQLADVAERAKGVTSEVDEHGNLKEGVRSEEAMNKRMQAAQDRQASLNQRYEALRKKLAKSGGRPLSDKEKAWFAEVNALSASLDEKQPATGDEQDQNLGHGAEKVKQLAANLMAHAKSGASRASANAKPGTELGGLKSPGIGSTEPQAPETPEKVTTPTTAESEIPSSSKPPSTEDSGPQMDPQLLQGIGPTKAPTTATPRTKRLSQVSPASASPQARVPQRLQRAKFAGTMKMLEEESDAIDDMIARLAQLNASL